MATKLVDHFVGALLGLITGDALGRAAKDHSPEEVNENDAFGREMIGGFYTEDTELTISVAASLADLGEIDPDDLARRFGDNLDPMRGYNPGELEVLYRLQQGMDWREANRVVFVEGSFGIGGTCRAAPVGLVYHDDFETLIDAAALSARVTHAHPLGQAGAVTVALAVGMAVQKRAPDQLIDDLHDHLSDTGYAEILPYLETVYDLLEISALDPAGVVEGVGNRLTVQECVPAALYCVIRHPDSFEQAVGFAARLGGDADSIAAITGAVAGAYHGRRAIPARWVETLEAQGAETMIGLGRKLFERWQRADSAD